MNSIVDVDGTNIKEIDQFLHSNGFRSTGNGYNRRLAVMDILKSNNLLSDELTPEFRNKYPQSDNILLDELNRLYPNMMDIQRLEAIYLLLKDWESFGEIASADNISKVLNLNNVWHITQGVINVYNPEKAKLLLNFIDNNLLNLTPGQQELYNKLKSMMVYIPRDINLKIVMASSMDTLIDLYQTHPEYINILNDKYVLNQLSNKFNVKEVSSFLELFQEYDKQYYSRRCFIHNSPNECMQRAARDGDMEGVELAKLKGANDHNLAMANAAYGGHLDIAKWAKEQGANDYNWAMANAAGSGHLKIVEWAKEQGAKNYNWAMASAAKGGHLEIVEWAKEQGASNYNLAMAGAAQGGHLEIVKWAKEQGANNYNLAMAYAAEGGNLDIVKWAQQGANDYNRAMANAARYGYLDIVKWALQQGANNYNLVIEIAEDSNNLEIVDLLEDWLDSMTE